MTYRLFLFVVLQALCLQIVYSQAIDHKPDDIVTETDASTIDSLDNQPSVLEPVLSQAVPHLICPQCGRPTHVCECGYSSATISDSYSKVVKQSEESLCPKCGLSVELCTCGLPEVLDTETSDQPETRPQLFGPCGLPIELCQCGKTKVAVTGTTGNQPSNPESVCPNCGRPTELCNCGFVQEVAEKETSVVDQPENPRTMCPDCGLPIEHCTCGAQL